MQLFENFKFYPGWNVIFGRKKLVNFLPKMEHRKLIIHDESLHTLYFWSLIEYLSCCTKCCYYFCCSISLQVFAKFCTLRFKCVEVLYLIYFLNSSEFLSSCEEINSIKILSAWPREEKKIALFTRPEDCTILDLVIAI